MRRLPIFCLLCAISLLSSCAATGSKARSSSSSTGKIQAVRTTAYTHTEADHLIHGTSTAVGSDLKFGKVRSAAADWSVYPVGTVFQIEGAPYLYQIDDYGSALVGTNTIDLYKPSKSEMNQWGVRNVNIKVIKWGSFTQSLDIMKPREKYKHVRQMVERIEKSS